MSVTKEEVVIPTDEYLKKYREKYGIASGTNEDYLAAEHRIAYKAAEKKKAQDQLLATNALAADTAAANNALARTRVTYGQNAERLAQAGLTGSGYSDNITREAYALRQNAVSDARVKYNDSMRAAADTELATQYEADSKLATDLGKLEADKIQQNQDKANLTNDILLRVKEGMYTADEANSLATQMGLGQESLDLIKGAADTYYQTNTLAEAKDMVKSGEFDPAVIAKMVDPTDLEGIKNDWRKDVMTDESAFMVDGALMAVEDAEQMVKDYEKHTWADPATAEAFRKAFEKTYGNVSGLVTPSVRFKVDNWARGLEKEGNDFKISLKNKDGSNKTFKVESGGEVVDEKIISAAKDLENGAVFGYDGKAYIYLNGRVYSVRGTGGGALSTDAYDAIFKGKDFSYSYAPEKSSTAQKTTPNEATRRRQKGITKTVITSYPEKHKR